MRSWSQSFFMTPGIGAGWQEAPLGLLFGRQGRGAYRRWLRRFFWSHHPQPDWKENAYTQWLGQKGKTWDELSGDDLSPFVKSGPPAEYHQTTWCAEKTIEFIRENEGKPWFFSFNCFDPHHPFDPPADYLERFPVEDMPLPSVHPNEAHQQTTFQKLDREWAHNQPGEFETGR